MNLVRLLVVGAVCVGLTPVAWALDLTAPTRVQTGIVAKPTGTAPADLPEYDFGDFRSETLAIKAWGALDKADYDAVEAYTTKCIELYEPRALEQSETLSDFASKEDVFTYWALNDVATSYLILGQAKQAQDTKDEEARREAARKREALDAKLERRATSRAARREWLVGLMFWRKKGSEAPDPPSDEEGGES